MELTDYQYLLIRQQLCKRPTTQKERAYYQAAFELLLAYDTLTALFDREHLAMEKLADEFEASTNYKAVGKIMREAWKKALKENS